MQNTDSILKLNKRTVKEKARINIAGSKSESNRLLILNALYLHTIQIDNLSDAEDTQLLEKALKSSEILIHIHHAGTAMRFLTAYYSIQEGRETILTGSERMKQRPIGILVKSLRELGADIHYLEEEGFPPLKIIGKKLTKDRIAIAANTSSQYISALLLIAPKLPNGLTIELTGTITSLPYLMMTVEMMRTLGIQIDQIGNQFIVHPFLKMQSQKFVVESDWSSASYFYSLAAIGEIHQLALTAFKENSLQGDSNLIEIYRTIFGVETKFHENEIQLTKIPDFPLQDFELNLNATPDIAQTIVVTAAALGLKCKLTGLKTLKIKETDRIQALQNELEKFGVQTKTTDSTLEITSFEKIAENPRVKTYHDHRMAMSFAPLALLQDLEIEEPEVVEKSYPNFWADFDSITL
ncbi:3-phosphoshikimate 1-carboxyvinyltransferase [Moheibacter stercoris]|uniref:3-phosphoshikimate 1-carboxyvinyltransferase n=1 Tax=Moheibacter stercoris TaxID=1628251 RepID=A0ABV2LR59_9FLAO